MLESNVRNSTIAIRPGRLLLKAAVKYWFERKAAAAVKLIQLFLTMLLG
jgi:hypothetical protein